MHTVSNGRVSIGSVQARDEAVRHVLLELERRALAVQQGNALADVRQADALARRAAAEAGAGVGDDQLDARVGRSRRARSHSGAARVVRCSVHPPRRQRDRAAVLRRLDAVLDGVLDQRDQHPRRQRAVATGGRRCRCANVERADRRRVRMMARYAPPCAASSPSVAASRRSDGGRRAQEADQVGDQPRRLGRALLGELLRAAERVEQEMRLDLRLQQLELGFGEPARQRRSAAPRPRAGRVSAAYSRLRKLAISATSTDVDEHEHEQQHGEMWRSTVGSVAQANSSRPRIRSIAVSTIGATIEPVSIARRRHAAACPGAGDSRTRR